MSRPQEEGKELQNLGPGQDQSSYFQRARLFAIDGFQSEKGHAVKGLTIKWKPIAPAGLTQG